MRVSGKLFAAALAALALAAWSPAEARIGVVLLHGNLSSGLQFSHMVGVFAEAGVGLQTPDMCWSGRRSYDRPALDCMTDVDRAIGRLKADGYDQIVVAGHSMGGINTLLYAAHHNGLAGVIVFAPSARTARPAGDATVAMAQDLVARGVGGARTQFPSRGNPFFTVPRAWLSFYGPDSPLDDAKLLPKLSAPLLWVAGTDDRGQADGAERFQRAPATPMNRFLLVKADHFATPDVALPQVMAWLGELQASLDKAKTAN
jgi:pimeloyl-ACP methyl ester carboxylesterase